MKKSIFMALAGMMFVSTAANAISVSGQAGEHYTNLGVGFGTESTGLALTGNWLHNDDDGDAAGLGLGLNIPLGPFLATVGGKGVYTNPNNGDEKRSREAPFLTPLQLDHQGESTGPNDDHKRNAH